jgi:chemotaxis protein MotC
MRRILPVTLVAALLAAAGPAEAQDAPAPAATALPAPTPFEMVRTLQALQAQMAEGNAAAVIAQRELLGLIADRFLAADAATWQDARNARAALTYTLSGGNPKVLRQLRTLAPPIALDANLVDGALAYADGNEDKARDLLLPYDARALPASLGGQIALIQAGFVARQDLKRAARLLDDARLLMPGTLIEEAALRREVFIVAQIGDLDRFEFLSRHYLRRFGASVYASDFRQRFATAIARLSLTEKDGRFPRLEAMLKASDVDSQRALFLHVARSAVVHGKLETARTAARDARAVAATGSGDAALAALYEAAAGIATADFPAYRRDLAGLARLPLDGIDRDLRDAALAVAAEIRAEAPPLHPLEGLDGVGRDPTRATWVTETMRRAEASRRRADAVLRETPKP